MSHPIRPPGVVTQAEREAARTVLRERARARLTRNPEVVWPLITLSREYGALGAALGRRVRDALGFRYWDRALVDAIAASTRGVTHERIRELDERRVSAFDETLADWILGSDGTQAHYLSALRKTIEEIADAGSAVVVGRGANFLVPRDCLRVRVVAPLAFRAAGIARRRGIDLDAARHEAIAVEEERREFIHRLLHRDGAEPSTYDLVLNSARIPMKEAAEIVIDAYVARFGDPRVEGERPRAVPPVTGP